MCTIYSFSIVSGNHLHIEMITVVLTQSLVISAHLLGTHEIISIEQILIYSIYFQFRQQSIYFPHFILSDYLYSTFYPWYWSLSVSVSELSGNIFSPLFIPLMYHKHSYSVYCQNLFLFSWLFVQNPFFFGSSCFSTQHFQLICAHLWY